MDHWGERVGSVRSPKGADHVTFEGLPGSRSRLPLQGGKRKDPVTIGEALRTARQASALASHCRPTLLGERRPLSSMYWCRGTVHASSFQPWVADALRAKLRGAEERGTMAVLGPTDTLRCFRCRNLTGVANLHVTPRGFLISNLAGAANLHVPPGGLLICSNCAKQGRILSESGGIVMLIGPGKKGRGVGPLRGGAPAGTNGTEGTGHDPSRQPAGRLVSEP
jgi:hypothetical protein